MPPVRALLRLRDEVGDSLSMIFYHTSGDFQNSVGKGRAKDYNIMGLPKDVVADGKILGGGMQTPDYNDMRKEFDIRKNQVPGLEITLSNQYSVSTGKGTIIAHIKNTASGTFEGTCHSAICQRDSVHEWGSPYNEDTCYAICFMMLPDYNGTTITVAAGETEEIEQTFTVASQWQRDDCYCVVFVQNEDKDINQAVEIPLDDATAIQPQVIPVSMKTENLFSLRVHQQKRSISIQLHCSNAVISIVNCAGVLQKQELNPKKYVNMSLSNLSPGMYFCVVHADGYHDEKKFLLY